MKKYRVTARSVGYVEIFVDAENKGASMKKYRVTARSVGYVEIFVDAENKKQALAKAEKIDGFDWKEYSSHWQILEAEEEKEIETKP